MEALYFVIAVSLTAVVTVGLIAVLAAQKEREETKRWAETQATERKQREADLEMARLGYVQEKVLLRDAPADVFKHGFDARVLNYGLAWVKKDVVKHVNEADAYKDLFSTMSKFFGVEIGKDTWATAKDKVRRREQEIKNEIRSLHREAENTYITPATARGYE